MTSKNEIVDGIETIPTVSDTAVRLLKLLEDPEALRQYRLQDDPLACR